MKPTTFSTFERPITQHSQFRDHAPERRTAPIQLNTLEVVQSNLTIKLECSPGFFRSAQQRFGSRPGVPLNVYHMDFQPHPHHKDTWVGSTHPGSPPSQSQTEEAAGAILSLFRSLLVFDKVFAVPGSYDKWVHDHQGRTPSHQDVMGLAKQLKAGMPYLVLPFHGLVDNLDRIRLARLTALYPTRRKEQQEPEQRQTQTPALFRKPTLHLPSRRT